MAHLTSQGNQALDKLRYEGTCISYLQPGMKPHKSNKLGVRGVCMDGKRYRATICLKGKQYLLGSFDTLEEAAAARKKGEEALYRPVLAAYQKHLEEVPEK
ncbi:MAG: hypothetical protein AB9880_05155 [Christensenellales bacterium]